MAGAGVREAGRGLTTIGDDCRRRRPLLPRPTPAAGLLLAGEGLDDLTQLPQRLLIFRGHHIGALAAWVGTLESAEHGLGHGNRIAAVPGFADEVVLRFRLDVTGEAVEVETVVHLGETAGEYLTEKPTRDDILSKFVGIRPLVKSNATSNTASLSRGHTIEIDAAGLLTITGGKWTTYRQMAEDAVDQAALLAGLETRPSVTSSLSISPPIPAENAELLHPDLPYTVGDVICGVRVEMARTVEDILARRTRALFLNAQAAIDISPKIAEIMATELGKDDLWISDQIGEFKKVAGNYLAG